MSSMRELEEACDGIMLLAYMLIRLCAIHLSKLRIIPQNGWILQYVNLENSDA